MLQGRFFVRTEHCVTKHSLVTRKLGTGPTLRPAREPVPAHGHSAPPPPRPALSWLRRPGKGLRAPPDGPHPLAEDVRGGGGQADSQQSRWGAESPPAKPLLPQGWTPPPPRGDSVRP